MSIRDRPRLVSWNAQSALNTPVGINQLKILTESHQPDLIALQETGRYSNNKGPQYPIKLKNYTSYEITPPNINEKNKHALALLIKTNINHSIINSEYKKWGITQTIKIFPPNYNKNKSLKPFYITNIYIYNDTTNDDALFKDFKSISSKYTNHIITGDFNAKNNLWGIINERNRHIREGNIQGDRRGLEIYQIINKNNGIILNDGRATRIGHQGHQDSAIDLTISFGQYLIESDWTVDDDPHGSDHLPQIIELKHQLENNYKHSPLIKFELDDADWVDFRSKFNNRELTTNGYDSLFDEDKNIWLNNIETLITETAKKCFKNNIDKLGKIDNKPKKYKHTNYWFNKHLKAEKRQLNKKLKLYRLSKTEEDRIIYRTAKKNYETNIKLAKREAFNTWANDIDFTVNSKEAYRKLNALQGNVISSNVGTLKMGDKQITSDKDKAELLANHYQHISSDDNLSKEFINYRNTQFTGGHHLSALITNDDYNKDFSLAELNKQLRKRKRKSATGSDGIEYRLIKNLPPNFKKHILHFFNKLYSGIILPNNFTSANIITILKPNKDPSACASYRPISLTNHMGKLMEAMVNHRLKNFLEENNILNPNQAGFRNKRECLDQVARIEQEVRSLRKANDKQYGVLAVFLDIEKAFDTSCRVLILDILFKNGVRGQMYNYIRAFLSNRTFRVKIGSELSEYKKITNGVPQGAVLSPTLFLVTLNFLNDSFFRDENTKKMNIKIAQFADDTAIFSKVKISDLNQYQNTERETDTNEDIDKVNLCANKTIKAIERAGYRVNAAKTEAVLFTEDKKNTNVETTLIINNNTIKTSKSAKYLGIILDKHLNFNEHLSNRREKSNKAINLISIFKGSGYFRDNSNSAKLIIKSLIESKMLYGREILPECKELIKSYKIIASCYKKAFYLPKFTEYKSIFAFAGILPPEETTKLLRQSFIARKCAMKESKVKDLFDKHRTYGHIPIGFNKKSKVEKFGFMKRTHVDYNKIGFNYKDIKEMERIDILYDYVAPEINTDLTDKIDKGKTPEPKCLELYKNYESDINAATTADPLIIFTDASRKDNETSGQAETGIGVIAYHKNDKIIRFSHSIKLNNNLSIASAEAYAIKFSLDRIISILNANNERENGNDYLMKLKLKYKLKLLGKNQNIHIFSDSLSALTMLKNPDFLGSRFDIIKEIFNAIEILKNKFEINVKLFWIPSHVGIPGNEEADKLANIALTNPTNTVNIGLGYKEAKSIFRRNIKNNWTTKWREYVASVNPTPKSLITNPLRKNPIFVSPKTIKRNRLLMNAQYFRLTNDKFCNDCNTPNTVNHLLLDCKKYNDEREQFLANLITHIPPEKRIDFRLQLSHFLDPDLEGPQLDLALSFINNLKNINI